MKSDDTEDLGLALERAAEGSSPFSIRIDDLVRQVRSRRRRRTVTALTSAGATFAAAGALAATLSANPGARTSPPAAPMPAATETSRSPQFMIQQRTYACGGTIALTTTSDQSADRVRLSVRSTDPARKAPRQRKSRSLRSNPPTPAPSGGPMRNGCWSCRTARS